MQAKAALDWFSAAFLMCLALYSIINTKVKLYILNLTNIIYYIFEKYLYVDGSISQKVSLIGVNIMRTELETRYTSDMNQKERDVLNEVLRHYDFRTASIEKIRSAYKVCTDKGDFCLKRVSHGYDKAKKTLYIIDHLKENGCNSLAEYYHSKAGKVLLKYRDAAFYLTNWIEGREASFSDPEEILDCSELLANFHNMAKGFKTPRHVKMKAHTKKWSKSFKKYMDEMKGFKEYIDHLKIKSEFDYTYRDSIDIFMKEAEYSIKVLDHSRYDKLCKYYISERYVCHDSFYYQNILIDNTGKQYIVDMESCQYDIPVSDLGKLIRRVLSKKHFRWDFDFCRKMIERYCKVCPLTKEEYEILLSILIFPHKFWKLGKKRYIRNKKWDEKKYGKKLHRLLRERKYKREFIYCYIKFYGLDIECDPDIIEL